MTNETNAAPSVAEGHVHCWHERADAASYCCKCEDLPHNATPSPVDANKLVQTWIAQSPQSNVTDEDAEDLVLRVIAYGSSRQPSPLDRGIDAGNYEVASRLEAEICKLAGGMQSAAWPRIEIVKLITTALQSSAGVDPRPSLQSIYKATEDALNSYRMHYTRELPDLDNGLSLADRLSPDADKDVTRGREELDLLIDYVCGAVGDVFRSAAPTPSEAAQLAAREIVTQIEIEREPHPAWSSKAKAKYVAMAAEIISRYCGTGEMK